MSIVQMKTISYGTPAMSYHQTQCYGR